MPNDVIEMQVRRQIKEEKDRNKKATNLIIKGPRDYGEQESAKELTKNFLRDQLDWNGAILQTQRIGKWIKGSKGRHVRVTMRNTKDKNKILSNRRFLKGTHIYLDDDLAITQQDETRKEWEKVKQQENMENEHGCKMGKPKLVTK